MAYAAVASLHHTIRLLLNSSRTSMAASIQKILKTALQRVKKLQEVLEKYDHIRNYSEGVMSVEARIRDEARKLEDAIESEASAQFQSRTTHSTLSLDLDHLKNDINFFIKTSKKMEIEYSEELHKPAPQEEEEEEEEEASALQSTMDAAENQIEMVGLSDGFLKIRDFITAEEGRAHLINISITGMAGIGKTTLALKLFHDSLLKEKFQIRAFVRVGQKYDFEEISRAIKAQLNVNSVNSSDDRIIVEGGEKFLIVLDDVWEWDDIFKQRLKTLLPIDCNGSCILVTTRITSNLENNYQMRFLNEEESWDLLRKKVFGEEEDEDCPFHLVKVGKKIAKNCEGLPLLIVTVGELLSKAEKDLEYWEEVAKMKNSVFEDAIDEIYEVLLPSYRYIGQAPRLCFLYMGAFSRDSVVRRSRIISLWNAEGFSGAKFFMIDNAIYLLEDLVSYNLVVVRDLSLNGMETKSFNLHLVYWHVSKREGERNKFLHILNSYDVAEEEDGSNSIEESIKEKRHLSIYHNSLLAMKEVHSSIESSGSTLRSVLCTGPYHQYQVPICFELRLLRVLDAVTIRFYEFPVGVVKLIQLRYLSLTTNANRPPFINKLWFLRFLIIHHHISIDRSSLGESPYVPVEIWELKELEHLQIVGRNLPHPPIGAILPNLIKLLDVGVQSCDKEVLERIPKLEKLRIQIELAPSPNADQTMRWCDQISSLKNLTSLKTVVKNPKLFPKPQVPPGLPSISMSSLQKLSLSGFGYPWEEMSKIAGFPWLQQLKLQSYAFRGEKWEGKGKSCWNVMDLLIEDTDLVEWSAVDGAFPNLCQLTMKSCYKLREIPLLESVLKIELVDCNPLAESCARRNLECEENVECELQVSYSWK